MERQLRVEKYTSVLQDHDEIIYVNQRFEWLVGRPVGSGEVLTLQLLARSRWGSHRVIGVYRLGLQILVSDYQLCVTDTLVDERNKAVPEHIKNARRWELSLSTIMTKIKNLIQREKLILVFQNGKRKQKTKIR